VHLESIQFHWRVRLAGKKAPYSPGRGPGVHMTPDLFYMFSRIDSESLRSKEFNWRRSSTNPLQPSSLGKHMETRRSARNFLNFMFETEIDSERHLPGSESLKGGSEEAPGSPVEAPRNSRSAILPRVWWLSKVRQDLQIPGCREHVLPTGATA